MRWFGTLPRASRAAISTTATVSSRSATRPAVATRGGVVRPRAIAGELAQLAAFSLDSTSSVLAFGGVVGGLAAVSSLSAARIESRVVEATEKAEGNGIDLTDLYYDFDLPGDQYPFGDGEEWMPQSWKPPKIGDAKYLPTKMLGQIQIRNNQYDAIQLCNTKGVEIGDLCVPFEDYEGEYDTNAKRLLEMRKRLEGAK